MNLEEKFDYYEILQITKKASQQEIKQAYKRLALIHHPDKNQGSEQSMIKFRQVSQAYTVLNDPKKRQNYDKYGVADLQGMDFQSFMQDFQGFDQFLTEILSFNTFDAMFTGMNKKKGKKSSVKPRGRAKGRQKIAGGSAKQMDELMKLMMGGGDLGNNIQMAMFQAMMEGGMMGEEYMDQMQKQLEKMILQSEDQDQDQQELTQLQMQILQFGQKNVQKKKVGKKKKKTETYCKLDGQKIEQDEILMHFTEKHENEFMKWHQEKNSTKNAQRKQKQTTEDKNNNNSKKDVKQQFQY